MFANNKSSSKSKVGDVCEETELYNKVSSCDLKSVISFLQMRHEVISEYLSDIQGNLRCIYFQDAHMKDFFNFYPDRICIDISCKFMGTNVFMYLFVCEDPNGQSEIVSLSLLLVDDSESLTWLLNTFKKHNPNWRRTKIVVADPDLKQRDIIRNCFPNPYIMICFYHAFRSFKKHIECSKNMDLISSEQKKYAVELFKNMLVACNYSEFDTNYQQFLMLHCAIVSYFREVWMPVQLQWRTELESEHEDILHSLNIFLENIDNTIKPVFHVEKDILEFVKKFFFIMSLKKVERSKIRSSNTHPVLLYSRFSPEFQISRILTSYASKFVIEQLDISAEINMDCSILSDNYVFNYFSSTVNASSSMCSCQFFLFMLLPCRHIFAVRKMLSLCVFDEALCDYSWTEKYYRSTVACLQDHRINGNDCVFSKETDVKLPFVSNLLEELLIILKGKSYCDFSSELNALNKLICLWKKNDDVYVKFEGVQDKFENKLKDDKYPESVSYNSQKVEICEITNVHTMPIDNQSRTEKIESLGLCYYKFLDRVTRFSKPESVTHSGEPRKSDGCNVVDMHTKNPSKKHKGWNFKSEILNGNYINYAYLSKVICHTKDDCLEWLRSKELIPSCMPCPSCGFQMSSKSIPRLSDGAVWICSNVMENKRACSKRCSVRCGTWFELTNMTFEQMLTFCYMWINGFSQNQIIAETGISSSTFVSWDKFNHRVCEELCVSESKEITIEKVHKSNPSSLESWLKINANEDTFLQFLHDAALIHRKDSAKTLIC